MINSLSDLKRAENKIPAAVMSDVNSRIQDWISSGGALTDNYIKNQFRYASYFLNFQY